MNNFDLEKLNEPYYVDDIDTPIFDYLKKPLITKKYQLKPLNNEHFLDLFEFRLQNEPLDSDPFDKIGEKFEDAYTQFFTYMCNIDNLAWVLLDRIFIIGFFLLEIDVDYNNYMNRSAHLYYELNNNIKDVNTNVECVKAICDQLFSESDIPLIEMHLDEGEDDRDCRAALERLGFSRDSIKDDEIGFRYYLRNTDLTISQPPRHMPFILKSYQDAMKSNESINNHHLS